ncbi:MAG: flagellar biosynthetic protein FliP [Desulfuromonas sp.]|uniref:flagellar type III secretion system pore protein FliP n=1 Tax=Desulfuromonas sp. TaxID=892 RepID=UPI000CC7C4C6|nr:flagellar type III secretion system pore protein FliP [Desulfuromonas sp.]PLX84485.1 MAG: flagellar biosynthetic protein FliP [Desulfuromonas sp.]
MRALILLAAGLLLLPGLAGAAGLPTITLGIGEANGPEEVSTAVQILFVLTVLSVAPAILLMTTAFTRIVIVLSFVRQAMGTQQMPPNQIIVGLALFLTFFIMAPVWSQVNETALQPFLEKEIGQEVALENALGPIREFMFAQTKEQDLGLLMNVAGLEQPEDRDDVPTMTLIPSFMLSELKRAFQMGFLVYIPFLVIDMVVASVLMAMGMMMLPPPIISLPFKLLLFVLVDGWDLVVGSLVQSFY